MTDYPRYRVFSNKFSGTLECYNNATVIAKINEVLCKYRSNAWVQVYDVHNDPKKRNIITLHRGTAMYQGHERRVWATYGIRDTKTTATKLAEKAHQVPAAVLAVLKEAGFSTKGVG